MGGMLARIRPLARASSRGGRILLIGLFTALRAEVERGEAAAGSLQPFFEFPHHYQCGPYQSSRGCGGGGEGRGGGRVSPSISISVLIFWMEDLQLAAAEGESLPF